MSRELELLIKIEAELDELKKLNSGLGENAKAIKEVETAAKAATEATQAAQESASTLSDSLGEAGESTRGLSTANDESAQSMKNLQGVGQQFTGALNGNISAMSRSIEVTPRMAQALTGAFSVLGAATFGMGVGTEIYKSFIEPMINARMAVKDLGTIAEESAARLDRVSFDKFKREVQGIGDAYRNQAAAIDENAAAIERAYDWAKKLMDVNYEIEEQRIAAMPAGLEKDEAQAELRARRAGDEAAAGVALAQERMEQAGRKAIAADEAYNKAIKARDDQKSKDLARLARLESIANLQYEEAQSQAAPQHGLLASSIGLFTKGGVADLGKSRLYQAAADSASALRKQIRSTEDKQAAAEKAAAEKRFWEARQSAKYTEQLAGKKEEAIAQRYGNETTAADSREAERQARAERDRIEEERKLALQLQDRARQRSLPEQVAAQREAAQAQTAQEALAREPRSFTARRNYDKELAEALQAEQIAAQAVATIGNTLARIEASLKQLDSKFKTLPIQ